MTSSLVGSEMCIRDRVSTLVGSIAGWDVGTNQWMGVRMGPSLIACTPRCPSPRPSFPVANALRPHAL
eukprot:1599846-Prorocentrum_lima.AAC.1